MKILGYTIPPVVIAVILILLFTTPEQKSSLWDAAKQYCNLQDTLTVQLTDSFIETVDDKETREKLTEWRDKGQVSINVAENAKLLEDLYEKKKIKLDKCAIIGAI
jgi:hypothetical protein